MIIDSDDEAPANSASASFVDKPEFEDDPTPSPSSLPEIVQTLDLSLSTAALQLAVLPMTHCSPEDASWNGISVLQERMVFAVACATGDNFVVTLPLTPPSHESKARPELRKSLLAGNAGQGLWGESISLLGGQNRPSDGIAISAVKQSSGARSRSSERGATPSAIRVVVAAHSREASGILRLWDVPLGVKPGADVRVEPFQTEYLPMPLSSISFNPTHITQLLAVVQSQAARVYDYSSPSILPDDSEGPFPAQGSWLLSLYPPFARGSSTSTARKPIVAAKWIAHGHAILALLADGQWGIWDIDGASPSASSSSAGLFSKANATLRGSAVAAFSVTGHLEGTSPLRNPATQKSPAAPGSGEFVPMTPHTRRDATANSIMGGSDKLIAVRGGIDVTRHAPSRGTGLGDESAVLWLGGADPIVAVIPIIARFWDSHLRRANGGSSSIWSGAQPARMVRLTDLAAGLLGERCNGAAGVPKAGRSASGANGTSTPSEGGANNPESLPIEVLLQGETRVVVVQESEEATSLTSRLLGARKKPRAELRAKAILAYPRPEKPHSVAFNLSISQRGNLLRPRAPAKSLFDGVDEMDVLPSTEVPAGEAVTKRPQGAGFLFANDLSYAADVPDDESQAENRDVDQEIMDIMEIDRELEQMETDRQRGAKRVFFEEG